MLNRGLKKEINELKLKLDSKDYELKQLKESYTERGKNLVEARIAEDRLKKKFDEEKALAYKTMELEFKGKMMDEVQRVKAEADARIQKGIEENFAKLKDSLAKLHEEGNAQTKFTEQIALKMMGALKTSGVPALEEK